MPLPEDIVPEQIANDKGEVVWKRAESSAFKKYNDVPSVVRAYDELERKTGSAVWIPDEKAPPEKWSEFHAKLGRPESPDKYDIVKPDGNGWDSGLENKFRQVAFEEGLRPTAVKKLADMFIGHQKEMLEGSVVQGDAVFENLKKHYGDQYEKASGYVNEALGRLEQQNPKLYEAMDKVVVIEPTESGVKRYALADHPAVHSLLAMLGSSSSEDSGRVGTGGSTMTDAEKEAHEIMHNAEHPKHALWLKGDKAVREYVSDLFKQATGGK